MPSSVTVTVTDEGGKLKGFFVNIKGKDTKDIDGFTPIAIEGDALQELLRENGGVFEFVIPAGFEHNIIISATDCAVKLSAGNTDSNTMEKTFEKVTVTTNKWLQFYADKPVFYSTIAAVVLVIGAVVFFVIKKKGKTEEAEG